MAVRKHIVPIFLPHWGCPYQCVYCDQTIIAAPENMLEISGQISAAIKRVPPSAHSTEVAFYGGTFTALPLITQAQLLEQVQPFIAQGLVDSIRVSTHPACLAEESLKLLILMGVSTVELGVQSLDPEVLKLSGREYRPETVTRAVSLLREYGFQVGIQLMPGLPGDTRQKTLQTVRQVIELAPDFVRVYPTLVIEGTVLADLWRKGEYSELSLAEAIGWCKEISKLFSVANIPIIRLGLHPSRELEQQLLAGPYHPAFKAVVDSALALEQIEAQLSDCGEELLISCNPRDISRVRGDRNSNLEKLKAGYGFKSVKVLPEPGLAIGEYKVK